MKRLAQFLFGTLRGRLILGVAVVHAVMMALFIADLTARQRAMLLDRQSEQAAALSSALAISAAGWILADDVAGLQELVEAQRRYPELLFAFLMDPAGRVLAASDHSKLGQYLVELPGKEAQTISTRTAALVDVTTPAVIGGRHVGWARVGIGQKAAGAKLAIIIRNGLLYALAAILFGSLIAWLMGRRITRRLYTVQETINKVRSGDRLARSTLVGGDEAAVLAQEFNAMLDAVAQRDVELQASEERYRRLAENARDVIYRMSLPDGAYEYVSPAATRIFGYSPEEFYVSPLLIRQILPPEWHGYFEEQWSRLLRGDLSPTYEYQIIHKSGEKRWMNQRNLLIRDDEGRIVAVEGIVTDITERKNSEEELRRLNEELEQRVKERTAELEAKNTELERTNRLFVGRELRMVELKERIRVLENEKNRLQTSE